MINKNLLRRWTPSVILVATAAAFTISMPGCSSSSSSNSSSQTSWSLGVLSRDEAPAQVARVRTFYVAPNTQPSMSNTFTVGTSLQQAFADQIANKLTARGLIQAPPDMADATVVFTVHAPTPTPTGNAGGPAQGLGYADQLLAEAEGLQTKDNFLENDRVDMRIKLQNTKTQQVIWRGSIAGVLAANEGTRGRMLDMLDAVDKLLEQYPKVER